jgi:ferric-dicitrate binding protein FerR (iron transport regulator)
MDELITRYLGGEATDAEVSELESWVQEDPKNTTRFIEMKKAWILSGMTHGTDQINIDAAWESLARKTTQKHEAKIRRLGYRSTVVRIAAAIVFLVLAGAVAYRVMVPGDQSYIAEAAPSEIRLDDGSTVVLNRESSLTWDAGAKDKRLVSLEGDAFFDIARDEDKPFVIVTEEVEVEVLGTSFYVDARPERQLVEVTVESGEVAVRNGGESVTLATGEKAVFFKDRRSLQKAINLDLNFKSVKTGVLTFDNDRLDAVVNALNRHYHAMIFVETTTLETCALTATFEDKTLDAVLQIIASTMDIEIVRQNGQIVLRGSCAGD